MASIWEMQLKIQNKKLDIVPNLGCVLHEIELKNLYTILPIKKEHIQNLEYLPFHHKDPFDRMLVSQAMLEGLTILTVDEHIMKYRIKIENWENTMNTQKKLKLAVLVSGSGSNLQVLIDKQLNNGLNIEILGVISNKETAYALTRAKSANINTFVIDKDDTGKTYKRIEFEKRALDILKELQPDLVVLAGFMKILTPLFIGGVNNDLNIPMINLHPSILPAYKGLDTHARVLKSGERLHGCSVHLVTEELDAGAVIAQAVTQVKENETADDLQARIHTLEHKLLPMVVGWFANDIVAIKNDKLTSKLGIELPLKVWAD